MRSTLSFAAMYAFSSLLVATAALLPAMALAADLEVTISKLRNTAGKVIICVWNSAADFPACDVKQPFRRAEISAAAVPKLVTIADLPDGDYAIVAMHDEGNGLKRSTFGFPLFGVGLKSDGWPWPIGRPSYARNAVRLTGKTTLTIEMRYF